MDFFHSAQIEDLIVQALIEKAWDTSNLLNHIRSIRGSTTKQGFYAALRKLRSEEIVVVSKRTISLNTAWIEKMRQTFDSLGKAYATDDAFSDILQIENGENISYSFSTIKNLDIFWGHTQNILLRHTSSYEPIYAYDPHYWFYIARKQTERALLHEIVKNGRQFLMTVGYSYPLDKSIAPDFSTDLLQYQYTRLFDDTNYYVTVIGDYVTEIFLNKEVSKEIQALYEQTKIIDEKLVSNLKSLLDVRAKSKMKISKNPIRAAKLKKRLGKGFFIKKIGAG